MYICNLLYDWDGWKDQITNISDQMGLFQKNPCTLGEWYAVNSCEKGIEHTGNLLRRRSRLKKCKFGVTSTLKNSLHLKSRNSIMI